MTGPRGGAAPATGGEARRVRLVVHGAAGRMGQRVIALAAPDARFQIVAALVRRDDARAGEDAGEVAGTGARLGVPLAAELGASVEADAAIDFSTPEGAARFIRLCAERRIPAVLATTGWGEGLRREIEAAAARIPVLVASNLSVGVALAVRVCRDVARALGVEADVEIVEAHHRRKKDAPSGTALTFARAIAEARGQKLEDQAVYGRRGQREGDRPLGEVAIHALRLGDVVGEHTVSFGFGSERIEIVHKAHSRDVFAQGALRAARFVAGAAPGLYGPEDMLAGRE